jgi:hypothetical protein
MSIAQALQIVCLGSITGVEVVDAKEKVSSHGTAFVPV